GCMEWECGWEGVGDMATGGYELSARGKFGILECAARRKLPLGFRWQTLSGPFRIGKRIRVGDVYDRMIVEFLDVALGAVRVVPAGTFQESPPLTKVAQINGVARRCEHQRTSKQHMRKRAR